MAKYQKKTNYREKYPGVSKEIIEVLEKSDRQMEYLQYDIKAERCRIDSTSGTVTYLPSREDSYERLLEGNKQFPSDDEDVDDAAIKVELDIFFTSQIRLFTIALSRGWSVSVFNSKYCIGVILCPCSFPRMVSTSAESNSGISIPKSFFT